MMTSYGGFGWIGMILGLVITIAVIIGLVLLVVWAVRRMSGNNAHLVRKILTGQSARRYCPGPLRQGRN